MANKAISELPQAQNVNNQDLFVLEQSGIAKKLPAETFITEQGIIDALAEALDGHGGIQSVTLASVSGRIRTYRITFTDQSATTFQVYDGTSIDRISRTSSSGLDDVYTIFLSDGTTTFFTVHNGADGNVSEAMLNNALKDKAPAVTETTESSAIANFTDGADNMPIQSLVAEIEPIQDLTYGDPYPAGSGANKFNEDTELGAIGSNGIPYATNDSIRSKTFSACSSNTAYYIFGQVAVYFYDSNQTFIEVQYANNNIKTSPANAAYFKFGFYASYGTTYKHDTAANNPSTVTTYSPYSNICPITGWTGCNVTRTGKNLFDKTTQAKNWYITSSNTIGNGGTVCLFSVPVGTTITVSGTGGSRNRLLYTDKDISEITVGDQLTFQSNTNLPFTITTGHKTYVYYMETSFNQALVDSVQLEIGSTATDYEPYQGTSLTVDWTTEAGTVYGGTIDVATGLLTVTHKMWTADGTVPWVVSGEGTADATFYTGIGYGYDSLAGSNNGYSNYFKYRYSFGTHGAVMAYTNRININSGSGFTTRAELQAAFAETPLQVLYPIAQPQTYQLTGQQLMTLLGNNSVWADTGNVSVTYPADTKMFIEKLTMPTEDDLVANQAITSGKYFMIGNSLYLALANIASGAQITIGTNAQRVSLADALNTINS